MVSGDVLVGTVTVRFFKSVFEFLNAQCLQPEVDVAVLIGCVGVVDEVLHVERWVIGDVVELLGVIPHHVDFCGRPVSFLALKNC